MSGRIIEHGRRKVALDLGCSECMTLEMADTSLEVYANLFEIHLHLRVLREV